MTRIALVVSDVDGTLVTRDKRLTKDSERAARRLHDAGIGFTITSARPPFGLRFLAEPLGLRLPIGAFNGSSIVGPDSSVIEQHLIPPAAVERSLDVFGLFHVDLWLFTGDRWVIRRVDDQYVPLEAHTIRTDPTIVDSFDPFLADACKIVGVSADADVLKRCEESLKMTLGEQASVVRSQSYYLDVTPPAQDKGTFVWAMARRLGLPKEAVATIGDMQNDLPMFRNSGLSIAMGNATDDVKQQASHRTRSNEEEGFAGAVDIILAGNERR